MHNLYVITKPRQHPQQLVERTCGESPWKRAARSRRQHFQEPRGLVSGQASMFGEPLDANC